MKLTVKLVSTFMLVVIVLATLGGFLVVRRQVRLFEARVHKTVHDIGSELEPLLLRLIHDGGPEGAAQLIRATDDGYQQLTIRWVDFNALPGNPQRPNIPFEALHQVAEHPQHMAEVADYDDDRLMDHYWMIGLDDKSRSGLELSHSTDELDATTRAAIVAQILQTVSLLVVAGLALAYIGIRRIGRPLNQLIEKTRQIGRGNLSQPVHIRTHDELAQLGDALNDMCQQLSESQERLRVEAEAKVAAVEQLRHAERLQTIGGFASGMAHELGTPLNVVSGRAGLIESGQLSDEDTKASAKIIKSQVDRISARIRQVLDFARRDPSPKRPADLRTIVRQTVRMVAPMIKESHVSIGIAEEERPLMASVDTAQIQQVVSNLIVNAAQAMPSGGTMDIIFDREKRLPPNRPIQEERPYVCVRVRDQGEGISEEDLQHIFEPFFTTKPVGQGTGLGLWNSYGIAQEHGGWIGVETCEGGGSCFSLYLPEVSLNESTI